jgi:peptide/nickel transport system substrate-binding protein
VIENPPGNLINQLNKNPNLAADLFPSTRVDFIMLDEHYAPFKDQNVRLALNYAIDRNAIVKLAYSGHATPGSSYMPYKMLYWNPLKPYPYNVAKAKALLKKTKWPNGFKTFLIEVTNDVAGNATAVVLKSQLAKIGIKVDIRNYELLTAYAKEDGGKSQMGQRYWTNDIIDPDEVTTFAVDPKGGANAFSSWFWNNPEATNLVHKARVESDPNKRRAMYQRIQRIVYDESPFLVLDYSPYRYAHGKWVHGFHASPLGNYNLSLLSLTVDSH